MAYVTEEALKTYVEVFHSTLDEVAARFFSPERANQLLHKSLRPAKIICYVSTQFGVAFEYIPDSSTTIHTIRGSARIESLVVRAPRRLTNLRPGFKIGGNGIKIIRVGTKNCFPFRLTSCTADVTFADLDFVAEALGWVRRIDYLEVYGDRRAATWSKEAAQSRAKDEVLAALFLEKRADREGTDFFKSVNDFRQRVVLVLGSYDEEGQERLSRISDALRETDYDPILLENVPDFEHYDNQQKLVAVGALCRFIVVDDSTPSGHLVEIPICQTNGWVTLILHEGGRRGSWMGTGPQLRSRVIFETSYVANNPKPVILEGVKWAEQTLSELKKGLDLLYPWRQKAVS